MPREIMQALAAPSPRAIAGMNASIASKAVGDRRHVAEESRVDADQEFRRLIGGAPEHDPVDMARCARADVEIGDAAIEDDRPVGIGALQRMNERVVERRDRPVVLRAQAVEPGFASMDDGAAAPAALAASAKAASASRGSCSSTPIRHLTLTGMPTAAAIAATQWRPAAVRASGSRRTGPYAPGRTGSRN